MMTTWQALKRIIRVQFTHPPHPPIKRPMIPEVAVKEAWRASLRNDLDSGDIRRILEAAAPHIEAQAFEELAEIQAQPKAGLAEQILEISRSKGGPFEGGLTLDECQWLASMLIAANPHMASNPNEAA